MKTFKRSLDIALFAATFLSASVQAESRVLHVYNWADYILP